MCIRDRVLNADDDVYLQLRGAMLAHQVQPVSEIETTYSSTICALAAAGTGLGIVNPYIADVFAQQLAIRPFMPRLPVRVCMASVSYTHLDVYKRQASVGVNSPP